MREEEQQHSRQIQLRQRQRQSWKQEHILDQRRRGGADTFGEEEQQRFNSDRGTAGNKNTSWIRGGEEEQIPLRRGAAAFPTDSTLTEAQLETRTHPGSRRRGGADAFGEEEQQHSRQIQLRQRQSTAGNKNTSWIRGGEEEQMPLRRGEAEIQL